MAMNMFDGLSTAEVDRLVEACGVSKFEPNQSIFVEGSDGDEVLIVRSGKVRIAKAIGVDTDRTLAMVGEGGVFGELALVGGGPRSASAIATEPTEVLALTREKFFSLAEADAKLGLKVMGKLAAVLGERLQMTTDLLRDTVHWGLEVSGASKLDLHHVINARTHLAVALLDGQRFEGQLLKADPTVHGELLLTFADLEEQLRIVPFHAVASLRLAKEPAFAAAGRES